MKKSELREVIRKESSKLNEGKMAPQGVISDIGALTGQNDHTQARVMAAKLLKDKRLITAYEAIERLNSYFSYMPNELDVIRRRLDKNLSALLKKKFDNADEILQNL